MIAYLIRRLVAIIPVLFGVSIVVFLVLKSIPGDLATALTPEHATEEERQEIRRELGLDRPLPVQYWKWVSKAVRGDLGHSISQKKPVVELLLPRYKNTAILALAAVMISTTIGISAGIISAARQYSWVDRLVMVLALIGNTMPVFWLGLLLILLFSLRLGWLPTGGMYSPVGDRSFGDLLKHLILPAVTLGAASSALVARMMRSSMLEVIRQDYVRTARAKGLSRSRTILRHAARNALLPVVTVIGLQIGNLLGGSVITETVFSWPGVGFVLYNAISQRDVPLVMGAVLMTSGIFVLINVVVDLFYGVLDPRISYG
jgi:peptide/nickel transport system permease protein